MLLLLLLPAWAAAQAPVLQAPIAASGEGQAGTMVVSYTVGELVHAPATPGNLWLSPGLLQPLTATATAVSSFRIGEMKLFPNPTAGRFYLDVSIRERGFCTVRIYDAAGKLVAKDGFAYTTPLVRPFDIQGTTAGTYLVVIDLLTPAGLHKKAQYKLIKNTY